MRHWMIFAAGALVCSAAACDDDPISNGESDAQVSPGAGDAGAAGSAARSVTITFDARVGAEPLDCNTAYAGLGTTQATAHFQEARLYVHDVRLIDDAGREVAVELEQDGAWQHQGLALLDFEDDTGTCANGTPQTRRVVQGSVPEGSYRGVAFRLGVPEDLNHTSAGTAPSPLNLEAMNWSWTMGRKFMRFDVALPKPEGQLGPPQGFPFHLGSMTCMGRPAMGEPVTCQQENRPEIRLADFDPDSSQIVIDYAKLVAGVAIDADEGADRGCISDPKDPECAVMFAALGLDPGSGQPQGEQSVFSVEGGVSVPQPDAGVMPDAGEPSGQGGGTGADASVAGEYVWDLPANFPQPRVPADNPMSEVKVELGRYLFYDTRLSGNGTQSCATCHQQELAFTDAHEVGIGSTGEAHPRGPMSLANVAYATTLNWGNPLVTTLEQQAEGPMFGENPIELGLTGHEPELLELIQTEPIYAERFPQAFPGEADPYTIPNIAKAIASFERTLLSGNSAFDRGEMSESAQRGEDLFRDERFECFHCHGGFNFSDSVDHQLKVFTEASFHNTGLYNLGPMGEYPENNEGLYEFTGDPYDMGKFKAPSLRNIAVTAPYMHDGSIATLDEVLDHYAAGGRTIREGPYAGSIGATNMAKSDLLHGIAITEQERADLIAFLESLTDESFLTDPRFSDPWK